MVSRAGLSLVLVYFFSLLEVKVAATATTKDSKKEELSESPYPIPSVVTPKDGGWPSALTGAPFYNGEIIRCCSDDREVALVGGVDLLSKNCMNKCIVRSTSDDGSELTVECRATVEDTVSVDSCERRPDGDTTIFQLENGLHFTSWGTNHIKPMFDSMYRLEKNHPHIKYQNVIFLNYAQYFKQIPGTATSNIPVRVQNSKKYKQVYRALEFFDSWALESKRELAKKVVKTSVTGPFPPTYLSCKEALDAVSDPKQMLFVKQDSTTWGEGINVVTRSELQTMHERGHKECGKKAIVQQAVNDLAVISGSRFDIRFYILFHNGRVYMHENASIKMLLDSHHDPESTESSLSFAKKYGKTKHDVVTAYTSQGRSISAPFMDAVFEALVEAIPVLQDVMDMTAKDATVYHVYGGDAMIRTNGKAVITEFNDWPSTDGMAVPARHLLIQLP